MHSFSYVLCLLASLTPSLAAPQVNAQTCQNEGVVTQGNFNVSPNVYAAITGTGHQCAQINSASGSALAWSTNWAWQNTASDNQAWNWIKSYAYGRSFRANFFPMHTRFWVTRHVWRGVPFAKLSEHVLYLKIHLKEWYADFENMHSLRLLCTCMQFGHTIEPNDRQHPIAVVMEVWDASCLLLKHQRRHT